MAGTTPSWRSQATGDSRASDWSTPRPERHPGRGLADLSHLFLSRPASATAGTNEEAAPGDHPVPATSVPATSGPSGPASPAAPASTLFVAYATDPLLGALLCLTIALESSRRGKAATIHDPDPNLPSVQILAGGSVRRSPGGKEQWIESGDGLRIPLLGRWPERLDPYDPGFRHPAEPRLRAVVNAPARMLLDQPCQPPISDGQEILLPLSARLEDLSAAYAICKRFGGSPRPRVVCSCEKEPDSQPDRGWALFRGFASITARRLGAGPSFCGCLPQTGAPPLLVETAQRWLGASQEEGDPLRRIVDAVVGPSRHGLALAAPGSATHANSTADAIAIAYGLEDEEASDLRALLARRPPASASV